MCMEDDKLVHGFPSRMNNRQENLLMWEKYAQTWDPTTVIPEDPSLLSKASQIETLGCEWGTLSSIDRVLRDFIVPNVDLNSKVLDFGSGGGRLALKIAPLVGHLLCCDISAAMLARCSAVLGGFPNVSFVNVLETGSLVSSENSVDFVYAFDVFVHMDLHTIWKTILLIRRLLRSKGKVLIHTANLMTDAGWARFERQISYSPGGFYFLTPEVVRMLLTRAGFDVIMQSSEEPNDFYLSRDYLVVAEVRAVALR
jgi:SAM-dependent methyltransferase